MLNGGRADQLRPADDMIPDDLSRDGAQFGFLTAVNDIRIILRRQKKGFRSDRRAGYVIGIFVPCSSLVSTSSNRVSTP